MSRAVIVINGNPDRDRAAQWAKSAAAGMIIEFRQSKRTVDQNSRLWACLTEIARKVDWHGIKLTPDDWKDVFTAALRRHRFVPGLEEGTVVPLGMRTSDMTKQEFSDLLELINAFSAERGIEFQDHQENGSGDPAPQDAAADESSSQESGQSEEAGGDNAPASEPAPAGMTDEDRAWLKQTARMLWAATGQGEQDLLKATFDGIRENLTPDTIGRAARDKGNSIFKRCKLVCFGEADSADTLELIAGIAGVEPKDLVNG